MAAKNLIRSYIYQGSFMKPPFGGKSLSQRIFPFFPASKTNVQCRLKSRGFHTFVDGSKGKIPSEIKPPLTPDMSLAIATF